ncbi:hypothetical protein MKW92_005329 [Papaver armeniacum]|nr:hypothetical protein MKW92_005329 [Papaver armeniacum]
MSPPTSSSHQCWSNCAYHKGSLKVATATQFQECAKPYALHSLPMIRLKSVCLP